MSAPHTDGQRVKLPAASIRTDRGTQSRHKTDPATIKEYAALMRDGVEFDPVTVYFTPEGEYVLSRGFHRLPAAIDAGRGDIDAVIRLGTLADAKWDSAGSNKHGLRCTAEDYRAAVALALSAKPGVTDREIARHMGVSAHTVAKYRPVVHARTTEPGDPAKRTGKDGKQYPATKKGRKKGEKKAKRPTLYEPTGEPGDPATVVAEKPTHVDSSEADPDPGDDVPEVSRGPEPPAVDLSELNRSLAEEGEEFNLPAQRDRAYARFVTMFHEWPEHYHSHLIGAFERAKEEVRK